MAQKDWGASAELNRMKSAGITLPSNPLTRRLAARDMLDMARTPGAMDIMGSSPMLRAPEGRTRLNSLGQGINMEGMAKTLGRTAAATGSDAQWAWPKLHDPFEYWRERCILPGELMNLQDGTKKVEDVVVGDMALTHKGRYRKIIGLGHKPFDGEKAYRLKAYYLSDAKVTEDHPFWAKKKLDDEASFIKVQELRPKDWVFVPVDREVADKNKINIFDYIVSDDWIVNENIITKKNGKRNKLGNSIDQEFEVSDELLWLLGIYLAEGASDDRHIVWYLSNQEIEYRDKIIDSCKKVWGLDARYCENSNDHTFLVELSCQPLGDLFKTWCGTNAHNKHFPDWVMHLPTEKQLKVLEGYLDGDGCYQENGTWILSASEHLSEQIRQMLLRCGYFPSYSRRVQRTFDNSGRTENKYVQMVLLGNDNFKLTQDLGKDTGGIIERTRRFPIVEEPEGVWVQIREIEEFDYQGEMYYFTVAEDHSFVISNYAVRNTWWFNMEDPDEQTRKIRDWARLLYTTHHLVPSLIDIYTRFPLLDIELIHPDKRISDFYNDLFFDGLNYQEFLFDLGREHWTVGEVFAMGSWHDGIGAWEEDEIINPNDVIVAKNRALRTYQYHVKVPEEIKKLIERRDPPQEYAMLMQLYPDVVAWARQDKEIPVSDVIMKQIKFKCLVAGTDILTPQGPRPVEDLRMGDPVIAWNTETDTPVTSFVEHNAVQDPSPVVTVTTKRGRTLTCTLDHPFLTPNGMVKAVELSPGDKVRVGASIDLKSREVPTDLAYFLGLMVGDGSYYPHCFEFHNEEQVLIDWVGDFVKQYGCVLHKKFKSSFAIVNDGSNGKSLRSGGSNELRNLLREIGIFGQKCQQKRIPQWIWEAQEEAKWAFLSGYLDSDGCLISRVNAKSQKTYFAYDWASYNQKLLDDTQLLLSTLGVQTTRAPHHIKVESFEGVSILREKLTPLLVRKQLADMWEQKNVSSSTLEWDSIKTIETSGEQETYALCIAGVHTHVSAGLVTKNTNPWSEHGTPILLRAFRMLMLEESLNAAQDAIADRLYSPLILATLGLPDVDQDGPWIPDAAELQSLRNDLAMAINSDFRLMTYHHGLTIQNAFGRESMPKLDQDFMRVQTNVMGVFGIGADLIQGGSGGTYASGALNRELITQMLSTYQHKIERFIRSRMEPVAERQGHYEMRNVSGQMVPVMETVLMVDEETGAEYVEERPKLAIPEVRFRSMNLRDETVERGFLQQLGAAGFPISLGTLSVNIPIDFDDEIAARKEEKIKTVLAEQQFKAELFTRLFTLQLPIPPEYIQEYQAYLAMLEDPSLGAALAPGAMAGLAAPPSAPNMTGEDAQSSDAAAGAQVYPSINQTQAGTERQRPEISYEQRQSQPKPSKKGPKNGPQKKTASVAGWDDEFDDEPFETVYYGGRMKFASPLESKKRKRMVLAKGMKINIDDSYEKFSEDEFKEHLASIIDEPLIVEPTNLDEHSSGEGGMDQPARKQIDPTEEGL